MSFDQFFDSIDEFIQFSEGDHAIEKVLIANNGIGATKAIKSIRRWSFETFGTEKMIKFVVMATPEDMRANAEYIRLADQVVDVPGGTNNNNYANINLICQIAETHKVDAVMPMWGHASENPALPTTLLKLKRRVTFIGPPAGPMHALGDKIGSTIIAQSAGVPTIAWNGDGLTVDYRKVGIPQEVYDAANVTTPEDCLKCADRIGYPVMIKASEGGGGKGIRKVHRSEDVFNSYRQVQSEIPGSPIFVMKMASRARHLEVQLLADKYGDAIALSGRDCSVQRRHQKIIEEGPPLAASPSTFKKMEQAAVALARTVGYCNAGTVEYLFMEDTGDFAFLELNPRLQVEHPVTENILGINLPACQLQVAMGLPLHRIADIRKIYGRNPHGKDTIDYNFTERVPNPRHCIAVRVTAENPEAAFQPTSGIIRELHFHSAIDVWGYFSVNNSGLIHEFADSQFGHIFAGGKDRESARRAMVVALKELQIRGEIRITIEYIIKMLQSDDFVQNHINTDWLDGRIARHKELSAEESKKYCPSPILVALCGTALQAYQKFSSRDEEFISMLKMGQVQSKETLSPTVVIELIYQNVKYRTNCTQRGYETIVVECNGSDQTVGIRTLADGGYLINIEGYSHLAYSRSESGGSIRLILDGHTCIFTPEYDPTKLVSSVAAKLARLLIPDGSHVVAGEPFVEIEVMKMYMPLKAMEAGKVHFLMSEGATLSPGDVIASVELDNPDNVVMAEKYTGELKLGTTHLRTSNSMESISSWIAEERQMPHIQLKELTESMEKILIGFPISSEENTREILSNFISCMEDELLPYYKVEEAMSKLRGRIDDRLAAKINAMNQDYRVLINTTSSQKNAGASHHQLSASNSATTQKQKVAYPALKILTTIQTVLQSLSPEKRPAFHTQTAELWSVVEPFLYSTDVIIMSQFISLLDRYLQVERLFDNMSFTDVVTQLRKVHTVDLKKVLELCRSHVNIEAKNVLALSVLEEIKSYKLAAGSVMRPVLPAGLIVRQELHTRKLKSRLTELSKLRESMYSHVSFTANLLLIDQFNMTVENRRQRLNECIVSALSTGDPVGSGERVTILKKFVDSNVVIRDLFIEALGHDGDYQLAVMELYLRKIYQKTHNLKEMICGSTLTDDLNEELHPWIKFEFMTKNVSAFILDSQDENKFISSHPKELNYTELANLSRHPIHPNGLNLMSSIGNSHDNESPRNPIVPGTRFGVFANLDTMSDLEALFPTIIRKIDVNSSEQMNNASKAAVNAVHIAVRGGPSEDISDDQKSQMLSNFLISHKSLLQQFGVRRVTFLLGKQPFDNLMVSNHGKHATGVDHTIIPTIFTFRSRVGFIEDRLFRHIEAPLAFHLDLPRLSNFSITLQDGIQTSSGNVHLYRAVPMNSEGARRYFARLVSFTADVQSTDLESLFVEALDHLALVLGKEEAQDKNFRQHNTAANHIFINVVCPDAVIQPDYYDALLRNLNIKYWSKMIRLAVTVVELKLTCKLVMESEPLFIRFVVSNPTGFVLKMDKYFEAYENEQTVFKSINRQTKGAWEGLLTQTPYEITQKFEKQRAEAMVSSDTLYVYDWPELLRSATELQWVNYMQERNRELNDSNEFGVDTQSSESYFMCRELVLCDNGTGNPLGSGTWTSKDAESSEVELLPIHREPGKNDVGMVAWFVTIRTPEFPNWRDIVVIANDITYQAGSFGTREDMIFFKASEFARLRGIPRVYLAANSGARIGMAQSLKNKFQVCWSDEKDPSKGFKYIYLTSDDYGKLLAKANGEIEKLPIICSPHKEFESDDIRYLITDIIGEEPDLGVENLMGSGLIAGETARAYDEIFTLTLVVGRTVGIGAYLVRLGQRTIQKTRNSPIILTGYQALNKLMGREIYSTNDQLGGPMIMFPNGVSHLLADTHFDAVCQALNWLSFVPAVKGSNQLPIRDITGVDTVDRIVQFAPQKGLTYDPRLLFTGLKISKDDKNWKSGFFDKNSFVESLSGWAKTVIVGRGRLGGIPMGVIVTENRTAEATKPADPADATSQEKLVQQAGGVWFPDSAYKTAQALRDFNREGLPCIIFANWRGFSGGQRDMFDEVLKFGSMIVDALVAYQQPLFVYIPPFAELRGGAWVVVDSTINSDVMEFYAAEDARGGVLEAAGAASIKFRDRDILAAAHRLDYVLKELDNRLLVTTTSKQEIAEIRKQIKSREKLLFGVFQQVAVHFADLHDTPGRMRAKGVIRRQVHWADSRSFFYWRLVRRLKEFEHANRIMNPTTAMNHGHIGGVTESIHPKIGMRKFIIGELQHWVCSKGVSLADWDDDRKMVAWYKDNEAMVENYILSLIGSNVAQQIGEKFNELLDVTDGLEKNSNELLKSVLQQSLTSEQRKRLLEALK